MVFERIKVADRTEAFDWREEFDGLTVAEARLRLSALPPDATLNIDWDRDESYVQIMRDETDEEYHERTKIEKVKTLRESIGALKTAIKALKKVGCIDQVPKLEEEMAAKKAELYSMIA